MKEGKVICNLKYLARKPSCRRQQKSKELGNHTLHHGLRTPGEEIAFTARLKIKSQSQIYRYGRSIFCLPHRPKFSYFFDLCLHWVSVVRAQCRLLHCIVTVTKQETARNLSIKMTLFRRAFFLKIKKNSLKNVQF